MPCCNPSGLVGIQKVESETPSWHVQGSCKNGFFRQASPPIRDNNRLITLLLGFAVCLIILSFVPVANGAILLDKVVAIVNKEVITWSDLYKGMEFEATDDVKSMKSEDRRKLFKDNEPVFLENMIDMKLQLQEAMRLNIMAGDDDVNRTIKGISAKYAMTEEMFKDAIAKEGFTFTEYRKRLSEQLTIGRLIDHEVKSNVIVTEADIEKYLSEHKEMARDNEGFDISQIVLKKTGDKKGLEEKAAEIYRRIKSEGKFSEIARQYSEDPSARGGGDLGFVKKSDMSKDFLEAVLKLKKGDVSGPFWSENGIHIVKVNEIMSFRTPQDMKDAVRQKLLDEKFSVAYKDWAKGLRERSYVEIK